MAEAPRQGRIASFGPSVPGSLTAERRPSSLPVLGTARGPERNRMSDRPPTLEKFFRDAALYAGAALVVDTRNIVPAGAAGKLVKA